jgi:hypothetical protein
MRFVVASAILLALFSLASCQLAPCTGANLATTILYLTYEIPLAGAATLAWTFT